MSTETITAPRTRWAAIIWGTVFAAIAAGALWMLADADRRDLLADGIGTLTPASILTVVLLSAGALLLVGGVAGLVRRAQRRLSAPPAPTDAGEHSVAE
jgi:predicted phage tail protein